MEYNEKFLCPHCGRMLWKTSEHIDKYGVPTCCQVSMRKVDQEHYLVTEDISLGEALGIVIDLAQQNVYDDGDTDLKHERQLQEKAIEIVYQHSISMG